MTDMDIEKEIVAKGKTAARVTPERDCQNLAAGRISSQAAAARGEVMKVVIIAHTANVQWSCFASSTATALVITSISTLCLPGSAKKS